VSSPKVRLWYALLVSFVACVATAIGSVYYASVVQQQAERRSQLAQQESDRRWCALLTDLDSAYKSPPPPATPTGQKVAAEIHRLRISFGCPER
jgi:hypothetical protein